MKPYFFVIAAVLSSWAHAWESPKEDISTLLTRGETALFVELSKDEPDSSQKQIKIANRTRRAQSEIASFLATASDRDIKNLYSSASENPRLIIDKKIFDLPDEAAQTAFGYAVHHCRYAAVKALAELGADLDQKVPELERDGIGVRVAKNRDGEAATKNVTATEYARDEAIRARGVASLHSVLSPIEKDDGSFEAETAQEPEICVTDFACRSAFRKSAERFRALASDCQKTKVILRLMRNKAELARAIAMVERNEGDVEALSQRMTALHRLIDRDTALFSH